MTNRFPIFSGKCVVAQCVILYTVAYPIFAVFTGIRASGVELHGQMFTKDREGNTVLSLCNRLARRKVLQSSFRLLTH